MTERELNEQIIRTIMNNMKALAMSSGHECVNAGGCSRFAEMGVPCSMLSGCRDAETRNYFPMNYNAGTSNITEEDMWNDNNSLREGITETAYCDRVFELIRHIKHGKKVSDSDYTELGKLVFDDVDNYIFKRGEGR